MVIHILRPIRWFRLRRLDQKEQDFYWRLKNLQVDSQRKWKGVKEDLQEVDVPHRTFIFWRNIKTIFRMCNRYALRNSIYKKKDHIRNRIRSIKGDVKRRIKTEERSHTATQESKDIMRQTCGWYLKILDALEKLLDSFVE